MGFPNSTFGELGFRSDGSKIGVFGGPRGLPGGVPREGSKIGLFGVPGVGQGTPKTRFLEDFMALGWGSGP